MIIQSLDVEKVLKRLGHKLDMDSKHPVQTYYCTECASAISLSIFLETDGRAFINVETYQYGRRSAQTCEQVQNDKTVREIIE